MKGKYKYNIIAIYVCTENQNIEMYKVNLSDMKGDIDSNSIAMVGKVTLFWINIK